MKFIKTTSKPLIFGVAGFKLTEAEKTLFTKNQVAGFILFERNIESKEQLFALVSEIKSLYSSDNSPLILIDQEGGRVARLKPPLCKDFQPADFFGKIYDESGKQAACLATKKNSAEIMAILKTYGIDSPCAPVGDLQYEYTDKVIGDRSFGNQVDKVVDLCSSFIEGIKEEGGFPIIKHIPGHGRATCDSHLALPRVTNVLNELNNTDFEVFRRLSINPQVNWAMTAHIIYDALDPDRPVTLSNKAIKFIRKSIGFKGVLITDAIEMLALHGEIGVKYHELKKVISINYESDKIKEQHLQKLLKLELIDENFKSQQNSYQLKYLQSLYNQYKLEFTQSLCNAALSSLNAGCNIILHCTGDIDEMAAICEII